VCVCVVAIVESYYLSTVVTWQDSKPGSKPGSREGVGELTKNCTVP
jgi:hypothetical protein